jgi:hypothetical protein
MFLPHAIERGAAAGPGLGRPGALDGILSRGYTVVKWSNHQTTNPPNCLR